MPDTADRQARRLHDILTLAARERAYWPRRLHALQASGVPLAAEDPPADPPKPSDPPADPPKDPPADPPSDPSKDPELGAGGEAALKAERKLRQAAEKTARETKARLDALEAEKLSDTEKLQKRADDAEAALQAANTRVRDANLTQALAAAGVAHPKAAARLLDGVEFDDASHEPTNLDDALKAAKASYGDEMFKPARTPPAGINPGAGAGGGDGPVLTAEELAAAKGQGMTPDEWAYYRDNPAAQAAYEPAKT
jgi:hypothetical protein